MEILFLGVVALSLHLGPQMPSIFWIGLHSVVLLLLYLGAMRMVFTYEKRRIGEFVEMVEDAKHRDISKRDAYALYALNAVFIIAAATYLPHIGEAIAQST